MPDPAQPFKNEVSDVLEERLIDAEYKIWKKNTPYLYDFVMTHSLEWPSLTCQWLPNTKSLSTASDSKAVEHNLLVGTHTTGEQNYLMVASVNLPQNDTVIPPPQSTQNDDSTTSNNNNTTNSGSSTGNGNGNSNSNNSNPTAATFTVSNYDEEKNEVGGFGATSSSSSSSIGKIEIRMKIKHTGEVNRARYMPQNHFIVASRGPDPEIFIWDLSKHCSFPDEDSVPTPQGVCVGHKAEGYGMCWSRHKEGMLVSSSEDATVCLWDVNEVSSAKANSSSGTQLKPISVFRGHTDVVEDVDWHHRDVSMIGSVGDDKSIRIWDVRENNPLKPVHCVEKAHNADINSIAFNPVNEFLLATGSADKTVALWDMRNLKR
jgi:histone-binding protein RBBP4